jgi:hypothetical protein
MANVAAEAFTVSIARQVTGIVSPEDAEHFDEDAADYFVDPRAALRTGGDETLGVGIDAAGVAIVAVSLYIADKIVDYVISRGLQAVESGIAKLRRSPDPIPPLTARQQADVRELVVSCGKKLNLPEPTASQLADAFVAAFPSSGK